MDFKNYWQDLDSEAKKGLAGRLNTSVAVLSQVANGHRRVSPARAQRIESETAGKVTRSELLPDVYPPESQQSAAMQEAANA